jgi:hypothetical protein
MNFTRFAGPRQGKGPRLPKAGRAAVCGYVIGIGISQLLYSTARVDHEDLLKKRGVGPAPGRLKQEGDDPVEITVTTKFGTVSNTSAAIELFGAMLRAVEMTEQRIAEGRRNGCTGNEDDPEGD